MCEKLLRVAFMGDWLTLHRVSHPMPVLLMNFHSSIRMSSRHDLYFMLAEANTTPYPYSMFPLLFAFTFRKDLGFLGYPDKQNSLQNSFLPQLSSFVSISTSLVAFVHKNNELWPFT